MNEIERAIRFYEGHPDGQYDELAAEALRQMLARTLEGQNPYTHRSPNPYPKYCPPEGDSNQQPRMTETEVLERRLRDHAPEIAKNIMDHNAVLRMCKKP